LTCQYRELGLELPQNYQIPIVFYLPEKGLDNWQIYSAEQQANDKITAESIAANHDNILEALNKHNVEFLLLLDNLGDLTFLRFPVIFWVAYSSSLNIAEVLYEQTNEFFLKSFKDYLKDLLLNAWRLETNRLHASMRVVYLRMALELGLMDLIKEIITVKLVDEDNSTHYGHFLFRLIEGKEFQLLTEILTNQNVDLEKTNSMGETLLHFAAKINHLELVKLLIEKGANTMAMDKNSLTPLVVCIQKGIDNREMIELILQHSSKDSKDLHLELHALERACVLLNKPVLETLLKFGMIKGSMNTVLLNYVMSSLVKNNFDRESRLQIVRMLLQSGANPTHMHREKSALQRAREQGLEDILREMENHTIQLVLRSPLTKST
jgi:ankyrin repeat protein